MSQPSCIPWVWFEAIVRRVAEAVRPAREYLVDYEGTLPFGRQLMLLLLWEAQD